MCKIFDLAMKDHGYPQERTGGQGPELGVLVGRIDFEDHSYRTWALSDS